MPKILTAHAPIVDVARIGGQYVLTDPTGRRIGVIDAIRGFGHYTGCKFGPHEGLTAVVTLAGGGDIAPIIDALASAEGLRNGRDDRENGV